MSMIKYVFLQRCQLHPHLRIPWIHLGWTPASIDHLVISIGKAVPCAVEKVCFLWSVCCLGRILLDYALLHFVLKGQICLLLQISLDFLLLYSNSLWQIIHIFCLFVLFLVLWTLVGLPRTDQFLLLWHQWLGHRLVLLWHWMVCLGNKPRSSCLLWGCTKSTAFWTLSLTMMATPFLLRDSCLQ